MKSMKLLLASVPEMCSLRRMQSVGKQNTLHMQAAGFDLERGIHGSKAKHMDPAVNNAIKEEEAKLEAEKDGLKMQKEV